MGGKLAELDKKMIARIKKQVNRLTKDALVAAATQVATEADKFVPIATGELRTTARVRKGKGLKAILSYGNANVKYARIQYFRSLRHFMPSGKPAPIQSLPRGPGLSGHANIYGRSYRQALKDGTLRRVPNGLEWVDRSLKNVRARKRVVNAFVNFYKK